MKSKSKSKRTPKTYTESQATALARQAVINATPAITRAIIAQAKKGHYLHARMLFDFIGLTVAETADPEAQLAPILKLFAEELGLKWPLVTTVPAAA